MESNSSSKRKTEVVRRNERELRGENKERKGGKAPGKKQEWGLQIKTLKRNCGDWKITD